jgi:predicted secreted protein
MRRLNIVILLLVTGCFSRDPAQRSFDDPGLTIVVAAGETFDIRLPTDRSTPHTWRIIGGGLDSGALRLVRQDYLAGADTSGQQTWTFVAMKRGNTQLLFEHVRAWDIATQPANRKRFSVNVW